MCAKISTRKGLLHKEELLLDLRFRFIQIHLFTEYQDIFSSAGAWHRGESCALLPSKNKIDSGYLNFDF